MVRWRVQLSIHTASIIWSKWVEVEDFLQVTEKLIAKVAFWISADQQPIRCLCLFSQRSDFVTSRKKNAAVQSLRFYSGLILRLFAHNN